jgi:hypothetical protein
VHAGGNYAGLLVEGLILRAFPRCPTANAVDDATISAYLPWESIFSTASVTDPFLSLYRQ